jgi:hypothetical protein
VLGIGDNDALWIVLLSLENYDSQFRRYPALLQSALDETMASMRETMALTAEAESRKARRVLAEAVTATALQLAGKQQVINGWMAAAWVAIGGSLLCGLSMTAGAVLATGGVPSWYALPARHSALSLILGLVLHAPAGWLAISAGAVGGVAALLGRSRTAGQSLTIAQRVGVALLCATAIAATTAMLVQ